MSKQPNKSIRLEFTKEEYEHFKTAKSEAEQYIGCPLSDSQFAKGAIMMRTRMNLDQVAAVQ